MSARRPRKVLINAVLIAVIVGVGVGAYLTLSGGGSQAQAQTTTATASIGTVRSTVSASGTVVSPQTVDANFTTGGTVTDIEVAVGDRVRKGQVLARVDAASSQIDLQTANAAVSSAEAGLMSAEAGLTSAEASLAGLKKTDATDAQLAEARAQVTSARASIEQAQASIVSARAQVEQAQEAIDGTELVAPIGGTVLSIGGSVGDTVSSGGTSSSSSDSSGSAFIQIADLQHLEVQANFSETDTAHLHVGQRASVTMNALGSTKVSGTVTAIDATSTTVNQVVDYGVTIELRHQPKGLRAGQTANVVVVTGRKPNVLEVPSSAVQTVGPTSTVTVLRNGRRVTTPVQIGLEGDQTTEIRSGLSEGDRVVISSSSTSSTGFPAGGFPGGGTVRIGVGGAGG